MHVCTPKSEFTCDAKEQMAWDANAWIKEFLACLRWDLFDRCANLSLEQGRCCPRQKSIAVAPPPASGTGAASSAEEPMANHFSRQEAKRTCRVPSGELSSMIITSNFTQLKVIESNGSMVVVKFGSNRSPLPALQLRKDHRYDQRQIFCLVVRRKQDRIHRIEPQRH